jgi:hypothetical protein
MLAETRYGASSVDRATRIDRDRWNTTEFFPGQTIARCRLDVGKIRLRYHIKRFEKRCPSWAIGVILILDNSSDYKEFGIDTDTVSIQTLNTYRTWSPRLSTNTWFNIPSIDHQLAFYNLQHNLQRK